MLPLTMMPTKSKMPWYANCTARCAWTETVNALVSEGITESAECGPGKVLAGLAKRINKEAVCTALTNIEQVTAFVETH